MLTGGAGGRAMTRAFEELFGVPERVRGHPIPAAPTRGFSRDAAAAHGIAADAALARFKPLYLEYLADELAAARVRARASCRASRRCSTRSPARDDVYLALLTGNYERGAQLKLEYFDLWRYFRVRRVRRRRADRNGLLPKALDAGRGVRRAAGGARRCRRSSATRRSTSACASAGGARSMAVATGSHTTDELRAAGADVVFEDLSDLDAVLAALEGTRELTGRQPSV